MIDTERLERVLVQAALERRPVGYGQLLHHFGRKVTPIMVGALCRDLGRVEERRRAAGLPELACLVVRKSDGLPGEGYFRSHAAEGAYAGPPTGPEAVRFLEARQEAAYRWARTVAPADEPGSEPTIHDVGVDEPRRRMAKGAG